MIDWLQNLWRSHQFKQALKQNNLRQAALIFRRIEKSGAKLTYLEKLYQKQLQTAASLTFYRKENKLLNQRLQTLEASDYFLEPDLNFCDRIGRYSNLQSKDGNLIQCTGIEPRVFTELEIGLTNFLVEEINKIPAHLVEKELARAMADLTGLKQGIDPQYNCRLSPHIYLLTYFLDNIYCTYLAWFLIYQRQLLPKNLKILDLAAGPGTIIYGLALLLLSANNFSASPIHINYYSLELQDSLQYRGLQFWRRYIESLSSPINAYFRFNTVNLFDYQHYASKLPKYFFDFVVVSHCFFYEPKAREESHQIYRQIFQQSLTPNGRVLLIVQGRKLLNIYDIFSEEDSAGETAAIEIFLEELGLKLEWYQYLTSTGKRTPMKKQEFARFAVENLPPLNHLQMLKEKYCQQQYVSHYAIDDYVILAKLDKDDRSEV